MASGNKSVEEIMAIYESNTEFKEYMDRYLRNNPDKTLEIAFEHKIVQDIAEYYARTKE